MYCGPLRGRMKSLTSHLKITHCLRLEYPINGLIVIAARDEAATNLHFTRPVRPEQLPG